jgi:hypothetical protein
MKSKKMILPLILSVLIFFEVFYIKDITKFVSSIINSHPNVIIQPSNEYKKDYDFQFVQESKSYIPYSYGDLMNIFYSIINNGWQEFTFYCPDEYENCLKDVQTISNNDSLLTSINNFAHPFNSFISVKTSYDDSGEVNVKINNLYSDETQATLNQKVDEIIQKNITSTMNQEEKIRAIHDYIINNTEYDVERNDTGNSYYDSNTAYGALIQGKAICSGYADAMAIFLSRFGVKNYKIASGTHVWNAVLINNTWLHLDLTWDDPVSKNGPILDHKYFLINNEELYAADGTLTDHTFDKTIYLEFK